MTLVTELEKTIRPAVEASGYEFVGLEFLANVGRPTVRVYIDKLNGVTIEDCQRVSGQVGAAMDVGEHLPSGYTLEVSSPGLDRPLFTYDHYVAQIGKRIAVKLKQPQDQRRHFKGQLIEVKDHALVLDVDGEQHQLLLERIQSARVCLSDLIFSEKPSCEQPECTQAYIDIAGSDGDSAEN